MDFHVLGNTARFKVIIVMVMWRLDFGAGLLRFKLWLSTHQPGDVSQ